MKLVGAEYSEAIVVAAIEVHRALGPGLLEKAYRDCLAHELRIRGSHVQSEVQLDLAYKGLSIPAAYRLDMLVDRRVVVEVKSVPQLLPVHVSQTLTYMRLSGVRIGLLINFQAPTIKAGLRRLVL